MDLAHGSHPPQHMTPARGISPFLRLPGTDPSGVAEHDSFSMPKNSSMSKNSPQHTPYMTLTSLVMKILFGGQARIFLVVSLLFAASLPFPRGTCLLLFI